MTAQNANATELSTSNAPDEQTVQPVLSATEETENVANDTAASRHGAATTARQWQVLSQLQRNRWVGTTHIYEQLKLAGFDISLRTVQRDLNALAKRFPIEKNNANPQGWRWKDDAP
ncbi:WYL domain-containing protein, partial [Psychrobacter sp. 1U2]